MTRARDGNRRCPHPHSSTATALYLNRHQSTSGIVLPHADAELRPAPASAAPQIGIALTRRAPPRQLDAHPGFVQIETAGGATGWINKEDFQSIAQ